MMNETHTIYVELMDEGTTCWRPVNAIKIEDNRYKIISDNKDPDDESWEFNTGDIVVCENRVFSDGKKGLVAVRRED